MKKALVISLLLVAGLGLAAFAGPLSGSWCVYTGFDEFQPVSMLYFESDVTLDYTTCGWTFSSTAVMEKHHFGNLYFEAEGAIGAFGFYGVLDFIPQTPSFKFMAGAVDLSIAGMTAYAIGVLSNAKAGTAPPPDGIDNGLGYNVGAFGDAGVCSFWFEAQFNLATTIADIYDYGYDYVVGELLAFDPCTGAKGIGYDVLQTGCNPAWTGLDAYIEFPFACLDLITKVSFGCAVGFEQVCFELNDLCLGIDWLLLDDLNICFEVQTKTVCAEIELVLGECVCIVPTLSLIDTPLNGAGAPVGVGGISLDAVQIEYDMGQGVTFKAGHLFNAMRGRVGNCRGEKEWHWDASGELQPWYKADCWISTDWDEYIAVLIDGDACCGGAFSVEVFNWFWTGQDDLVATNFMDWVQTRAALKIGVGANTTLGFKVRLGQAGLARVDLSACFTF